MDTLSMITYVPWAALFFILVFSIWRSNILIREEKAKAEIPPKVPKGITIANRLIVRSRRKALFEILGVLVTTTGAFIGLSTSFALSDAKSKADKKEHLIDVLLYHQQKQNAYYKMLGTYDSIKTDSAAIKTANFLEITDPYPYYSNINDPAIYDMTDATRDLMSAMDMDIRSTFMALRDNRVHNFQEQFLIQLKHFAAVNGLQVENEIKLKQGKMEPYYFLAARDSMVHDNGHFIEDQILKQ